MLKSQKYKGAKGRQTQGRNHPAMDKSKVHSAAELGARADSLGIGKRGAKTHKGRKILQARSAQLIEGPKKSIFIKGNKTS